MIKYVNAALYRAILEERDIQVNCGTYACKLILPHISNGKEITVTKTDSGSNAVTVVPQRRQELSNATRQKETATVIGTITGAGTVTLILTSAELDTSPITLTVTVAISDTAAIVADKFRVALRSNVAISDNKLGKFDVSGAGANIVLTQVEPIGNDSTLNMATDNGTATGLTTAGTSVATTAGVAVTIVAQNEYKTFSCSQDSWSHTDVKIYTDKELVAPVLDSPLITQYDVTHNYAGASADWTLTAAELKAQILIASNANAAVNLILNTTIPNFYLVYNNSGYVLTVKNAAGTNIAVPNGQSIFVYNDGTNVVQAPNFLLAPKINQYKAAHDYGAAAADWTLTAAELTAQIITVSNASGQVNAIFNTTVPNFYGVFNNSGQILICKNAAGSTVALGNGHKAFIYNDGTNIVDMVGILNGTYLQSSQVNEAVALTATSTQLNQAGAKASSACRAYNLGAPDLADDNLIVTTTNMKVGAYTVAAQPDIPRNITVTHTAGDTVDTLGTIDIVGTDIDDAELLETITPVNGTEVAGIKAFKTIVSVTGVGWVIDAVEVTNDTLIVGCGNELGLDVALVSADSVIMGVLGTTITADNATVVGSPTKAETTIDMSAGTYNGTKEALVFVAD